METCRKFDLALLAYVLLQRINTYSLFSIKKPLEPFYSHFFSFYSWVWLIPPLLSASQDSPDLPDSGGSVVRGSDGGRVPQVLQKLPQKVQLPHSRIAQEGSVRNREQRSGLQNSKSLFQTKLQVSAIIITRLCFWRKVFYREKFRSRPRAGTLGGITRKNWIS